MMIHKICGNKTLILKKDNGDNLECECRVCGQFVVIDSAVYSKEGFKKVKKELTTR